jgi:hypothetical protein
MAPVALPVHEAWDEQGHACAICQTAIGAGEWVGRCPSCDAPYHGECWEENGGCASYGCPHVPSAPKGDGPAEGSSWWGQEDKLCPRCGRHIRLAALRCRHCGCTFESRAPVPSLTRPAAKPTGAAGVLLFIAGLIPFTAPLVLVIGGPALWLGRRAIRRWPPTRRAMAIVGVVAAAVVTLLLGLALALHDGKPAKPPTPPTAQKIVPQKKGDGGGAAGDEAGSAREDDDEAATSSGDDEDAGGEDGDAGDGD